MHRRLTPASSGEPSVSQSGRGGAQHRPSLSSGDPGARPRLAGIPGWGRDRIVAVYVLLVGINRYRDPVRPLTGCCDDIQAAAEYFAANVRPEELEPLCLFDEQATRAAVIDGFRSHLGRAAAGDTAVFWFSGHGSQAPVPPELAPTEPTGMVQTLVCVDSRHDGVPDLYDKEVALLIGEVAQRGAQVVTVIDSCHADGADRPAEWDGDDERESVNDDLPSQLTDSTRGPSGAGVGSVASRRLIARWEPALTTPPPLSALLAELRASGPGDPGWAGAAPGPRPVALAACRRDQRAQEIPLPGGAHGVFSLGVLRQLERLGPEVSYRDLMTGVRCYVENLAPRQTPVLFPIDDPAVDRAFLGGALSVPPTSMTMRCLRGVWEIDAGACHGIAAGPAEDAPRVGVHGSGADGTPVREAEIIEVRTTTSVVRPLAGWVPDPAAQYRVVVTGVPVAPAAVEIAADPHGADTAALLTRAMTAAGPGGAGSPLVRPVAPGDAVPDLVVAVPRPGAARIQTADGAPLAPEAAVSDEHGAALLVADLEHVARWRGIKALENPSSRLAGEVRIELVAADSAAAAPRVLRTDDTGCVELEYVRHGSEWVPPEVFIALRNTGSRQIYCVLLDMTDRFRSDIGLFPGDLVAPHGTAWAANGEPIAFSLPAGRGLEPGARAADWLKVLIAEEPFNAAPFSLPRLGEPGPPPDPGPGSRGALALHGVLGRVGRAVAGRGAPESEPAALDWATVILPVVTRVPGGVR